MSESSHPCPRCGRPSGRDAPDGLCAACGEAPASGVPGDSTGSAAGSGSAAAPASGAASGAPPPDGFHVPPPGGPDSRPLSLSVSVPGESESYRGPTASLPPSSPARLLGESPLVPGADRTRYELIGELGHGGMGVVLRAQDRDLRREVALKVLAAGADERRRLRFVDEAQITGQLEHPNIVPIHDLGVDAAGRLYFAMKLVKGRSLSEQLRDLNRRRQSSIQSAASMDSDPRELRRLLQALTSICHAVAFAHSRGVVHRDLKPSNVMLGDFGEVQVMDWGLAKAGATRQARANPRAGVSPAGKAAGEDASDQRLAQMVQSFREQSGQNLTVDGHVMGTPAYMPPEQARGDLGRVDERSDVYSLGAILYEILTSHPPVEGKTVWQTLDNVIHSRILPPQQRAPDRFIPTELSAIAVKALAREPALRYQNVAEFREDLERFLAGRSVRAKEDTAWEALVKLARRNRGAAWASACSAALLAVVVALALFFNWRAAARAEESAKKARREESRARDGQLEAAARQREAETARDSERAQRARAAFEAYRLGLLQADRLLSDRRPLAALQVLAALPMPFRGWEHGRLAAQAWGAWQPEAWAAFCEPHPTHLAFSSPARPRFLLAALSDGAIQVRAARDGALLATLREHRGPLTALAASDGEPGWAASAGRDGAVKLWRLPAQSEPQLVKTFADHDGLVSALAFSDDGALLASAGADRTLRLWDTASGKAAAKWDAPDDETTTLAFSPDAETLVACSARGAVSLRRRKTGEEFRNLKAPAPLRGLVWLPAQAGEGRLRLLGLGANLSVRAWDGETPADASILLLPGRPGAGLLAAAPDGLVVFADGNGAVEVHRAEELLRAAGGASFPAPLLSWTQPPHSELLSLALSGGRLAACGRDGRLSCWSPAEAWPWSLACGAGVQELSASVRADTPRICVRAEDGAVLCADPSSAEAPWRLDGPFSASALSSDGRRLALAKAPSEAAVWDATARRVVRAWSAGHRGGLGALACSPEGKRVASGGEDREVRVWDVERGAVERSFGGLASGAARLIFSSDGRRLAAITHRRTARVWDLETGRQLLDLAEGEGRCVAFSEDGSRAAAGGGAVVAVWELDSGRRLAGLRGHAGAVNSLAWSADGRLFSGGEDGQIKVWDPEGFREVSAFSAGRPVAGLQAAPSGLWVAGGRTVSFLESRAARPRLAFAGLPGAVRAAAFAHDGKGILAADDEGTLRLWAGDSGDELRVFRLSRPALALFSAPDGPRLLCRDEAGRLELWDAGDGRRLASLAAPEQLRCAAVSPDGARVACGLEQGLQIREVAGNSPATALAGHSGAVTAAAFDPSGRRLVSAGEDRTLRVWEVAAGREVLRFRSPVRAVTAVGASGDGLRVAVGDSEGGIHVYHPRNSSYSPVLRAHQGPVQALAFSPDGRRLISGGQDAAVMVWGE